ncbi:hypothetical protein B0H15DRAFT_473858 [Mycena belliarum]|uniref:Uncharacterized protein n=1 Tax=Mycena belliarum TaxID=1033014 RepID=A0AAD6U0T3_9AGAR|nr:hypothetical protein B0H15DRAFT_473858 [Mycena belliae]
MRRGRQRLHSRLERGCAMRVQRRGHGSFVHCADGVQRDARRASPHSVSSGRSGLGGLSWEGGLGRARGAAFKFTSQLGLASAGGAFGRRWDARSCGRGAQSPRDALPAHCSAGRSGSSSSSQGATRSGSRSAAPYPPCAPASSPFRCLGSPRLRLRPPLHGAPGATGLLRAFIPSAESPSGSPSSSCGVGSPAHRVREARHVACASARYARRVHRVHSTSSPPGDPCVPRRAFTLAAHCTHPPVPHPDARASDASISAISCSVPSSASPDRRGCFAMRSARRSARVVGSIVRASPRVAPHRRGPIPISASRRPALSRRAQLGS